MAPSPVEAGGFSPPTTTPPQSSYRELDNAFLQNQTRIWLGEVLNMRFDKDMNISDLLADGQILFEVYKEIRRMLISVDHSSQQKFLEKESVSSSEITEIFPYAKVERFLEVCQGLGVSDIDLFTTSDVVDKRNTWKVCICLRSLSKKARSKNLNIPEFDSVTVTHKKKSPVNMPTDMVGNRRRNLERASSSPVLSNDDMRKVSKLSRQGDSVGFHADSSAYKSDNGEDDDCESDTYTANCVSPRTPDISEVGDFGSVQSELEQLKIEDPDEDEIVETFSPSQALRSAVGDNFELVDHQSNDDHENNLETHSPILVDWQALDEESGDNDPVKFDDTTADNETESNENDCCSHIKLADSEIADIPSTSSIKEDEDFGSSVIESDNGVHKNDVEAIGAEETVQHRVDLSYEDCRDIKCIEDMEKPLSSHSGNSEVVPSGGLENCDDTNSKCHLAKDDLPIIEDSDKSQVAKDENKKTAQQCKPPRKMLKLIAGGTGTVAAVGVMLYYLQLRKPPRFYTFLTKAPLCIFFSQNIARISRFTQINTKT